MNRLFIWVAALVVPMPIYAAGQLESVIDALAIPITANHTNNDWSSMEKVKVMRWTWPYNKSGMHDHTMEGMFHHDATIFVQGARTLIASVTLSFSNDHPKIGDFGKGQAVKIATDCDDDSMNYSVAFYQFTRPEHKPLYIRYEASFGASGSGSVEYNIAYHLDDSLRSLYPKLCKVVDSAVRHVQPEKQGLSREEISGIAARTFLRYRVGKVSRILAEENSCWKKAEYTLVSSAKDNIFATCAVSLFSGAAIEAAYARSELRDSHPQYSPTVIQERLLEKSKIVGEERAKKVIEHISNNTDAIMSSLFDAGMR